MRPGANHVPLGVFISSVDPVSTELAGRAVSKDVAFVEDHVAHVNADSSDCSSASVMIAARMSSGMIAAVIDALKMAR